MDIYLVAATVAAMGLVLRAMMMGMGEKENLG